MSEQDYEQLTLFPADSPASRFPWQESKKGKGMTVTYGLRCSELSESCACIALSVRMFLESSGLPPGKWSRIWSRQGITSSCSVLKLRLSERGTGERECSLWPTPTAIDPAKERMKSTQQAGNSRHSLDLPRAVRLWPTPRANEGKDVLQSVPPSRQKEPGKCNLTQAVALEMLATPCARDYRTGQRRRWEDPKRANNLNDQIGGQLNPMWVEWLQGFPIGWTDLNASETR
nr:MAG TPA: hypothetical protein [Caudoviricetes sp.]